MGAILGHVIAKMLKMVPVATLLGAQHYKVSTGFSYLKAIASCLIKKYEKVGITTNVR